MGQNGCQVVTLAEYRKYFNLSPVIQQGCCLLMNTYYQLFYWEIPSSVLWTLKVWLPSRDMQQIHPIWQIAQWSNGLSLSVGRPPADSNRTVYSVQTWLVGTVTIVFKDIPCIFKICEPKSTLVSDLKRLAMRMSLALHLKNKLEQYWIFGNGNPALKASVLWKVLWRYSFTLKWIHAIHSATHRIRYNSSQSWLLSSINSSLHTS